MDICKMPIDEIMQLPEHVFGRRYLVGQHDSVAASATEYGFTGLLWPKKFIIWEISSFVSAQTVRPQIWLSIRFNDALPANDTEFEEGKKIFDSINVEASNRDFVVSGYDGFAMRRLKQVVERNEGGLAFRYENQVASQIQISTYFTISMIPQGVKEWPSSV